MQKIRTKHVNRLGKRQGLGADLLFVSTKLRRGVHGNDVCVCVCVYAFLRLESKRKLFAPLLAVGPALACPWFGFQREEASSREAVRKREEALQRERERDRLRRDKVHGQRRTENTTTNQELHYFTIAQQPLAARACEHLQKTWRFPHAVVDSSEYHLIVPRYCARLGWLRVKNITVVAGARRVCKAPAGRQTLENTKLRVMFSFGPAHRRPSR